MVTIIPRSEWTSTPNRRAGRDLKPSEVTAIAVHYPATGNTKHKGETKAQTAARLRGWRELHVRPPRSWADIGYNYAIDQAGRVWDLTGLNRGAHAGTAKANRESVGVLLIVGNKETPTDAMLASFRELRAWIIKRLPKAAEVRPHSSYVSTACPGDKIRRLIASGELTRDPDVVPWYESRFLNLKGDDTAGARSFADRAPKMVADLTKGKPDIIGVCELRDAQAKKVFTPLMEDAGYFAAYVGAGNGLYLRRGTKFRSRGTYYLPKAVQGKGRREALLRCRVKVNGHWLHVGVTHLDYRSGPKFDKLRVKQAKSVVKAMRRFGVRFCLTKKARHIIMMDSNSQAWVRDKAMKPRGYVPAVKYSVDEQYVGKKRPVLSSRSIVTASDHRIVACVIGKARPKR